MVMRMIRLDDNSGESIEETISKVEQWAKEHPIKTRQNKFLKMFPNADLCQDVIDISPCSIEKKCENAAAIGIVANAKGLTGLRR